MIFNHKLFWLLLPCSLTSLSTISFSSTESSNPIQDKAKENSSLSLEKELEILSTIGSSDKFLDFGDSKNTDLKDLIKQYVKTTSGAKILSKRLTQHLIVSLIDNHEKDKSSHIRDKLKSRKLSLSSTNNLSNLGEKERQEAKFLFAGNEQKYNENVILEKSQDIFEPILNEVLGDLNLEDNGSKFKRNDHGDPLIALFSEFWDYVLDDYIQYERPIPFKKLTWKYDTQSRKEDIRGLFNNPDSSLPEEASYFFPFISASSEDKFKQFLEKISTQTPDSKTLQEYSDIENIDLVVPITSLSNSEYTSQFTVAALETYYYLVSPNSSSGKKKDEFLRDSGSTKKTSLCENKPFDIPEVSIENLTKETKELFCLKKEQGNNGSKNVVSDFVYLISTKQQQQQQQQQQSWILFKDKEGIHALTYDKDAFEIGEKTEKLKKHLMNLKDFDLKGKLSRHLNAHFERLILGNWDSFLKKNNKELKELKELARRLNKFLLRSSYSSKLTQLRKALLKDFQINFLDTLQKKEGKFENNWKLAFAGKFPYKFFSSKNPNVLVPLNKDNLHEQMIPHLEDAYLLRLGHNSRLGASTDSFWDVKASYESYVKELEKDLFTQAEQNKNKGSFSFFEFSNSSVSKISTTTEVKKIDLLDSVWLSLLKEEKLIEVLLQEKLKNVLDFFDFSEWELKGQRDFSKLEEVEFKDGKSAQNKGKIILSYLHSNYLSLVKDFDIPEILGNFDFAKQNNKTKQLEDFFEKILRKSKIINGANGYDASSGGVALELFTVKWLSENKFENLRKHLRETLRKDSLVAFVFSKKFSEQEKCLPTTRDKTKIQENLEIPKDIKKNSYIFRSSKPQSKEEWACPIDKDMVNFASVTIGPESEAKYLTGYKGLVNGNWKDLFPEDIVSKLEYASPLWKDSDSLISYIDESVNSESKYEELIKILKNLFPSYSWDFEGTKCEQLRFDWRLGIRGNTCFEKSDSSFKDKKEQLKQYLKQGYKSDRNSSRNRLIGGKQLLDKKLFDSKNDWFTDKDGSYLISSSDGSEYQIYLIQVKYDDVKDQNSWISFLKTINSSPFFRELVKVAKDPKIQKQALLSELNSATGSLKSFKTGDDRLKRILGYSWLNLKN